MAEWTRAEDPKWKAVPEFLGGTSLYDPEPLESTACLFIPKFFWFP